MEDVSDLRKIPAELRRRGYSETEVHKIMGENFLRVFAAVENIAANVRKQAE